MESVLTVKDLKTTFYTSSGAVQAVRGISFDVGKGEIVGIVGESGSGKSVSSMSILRLLPKTAKISPESSVLFGGEDLTKMSGKALRALRGQRISMIFQDPMSSLNPLITVGKQVEEMIRIHHKEYSREQLRSQALELFRQVRIPEPEKRFKEFPHQFSGGMRQRVMIAMALACEPDILIADEPTTALDVTIQAQILELMQNLQRELGMAIILITHDLGVVAQMCDEVVVMYAGSICEQGTTDEIFYNPRHEYTKGLLRSVPSVDTAGKKLQPITGTPIDLLNMPKGCAFAPRCESAMKICLTQRCPRMQINADHQSACWTNVRDGVKDGSIKMEEDENEKEAGDRE